MKGIKLVVLDMAGTTVQDNREVETCFSKAAQKTNLPYTQEEIVSMMGWSKRKVFETLWNKQPLEEGERTIKTDESYKCFCSILEEHYRTQDVRPTEGCVNMLATLREKGVKIALTTGFYREVTSIILDRLGWNKGLDVNFVGNENSIIDLSIASDEVEAGRPAPDMIHRAMKLLHITDPKQVLKVGDTPSDLEAGRNANCALSLAVTNGTHTKSQLEKFDNDGLIDRIDEIIHYIEKADY